MHTNIIFQKSQELKKNKIEGTFFKVMQSTIHIQKRKYIRRCFLEDFFS